MHEIKHLEPPPLLGKSNQEKRVDQKQQKGLKSINTPKEIWKEKTTSKNKNSPKLQTRYKPILFWKEFDENDDDDDEYYGW